MVNARNALRERYDTSIVYADFVFLTISNDALRHTRNIALKRTQARHALVSISSKQIAAK
ncbi:MAG: hypothetical protein B6D41_15365 [Chloroflexi bacterium UTCFX4]|nr:MAG: hypothetical protein B6D41_15365 [Chloroflexi bacterium UTCFX4]